MSAEALRAEIDRLDAEHDRREAAMYATRDARVAALAAMPGNAKRLQADAERFRQVLGTATVHYEMAGAS